MDTEPPEYEIACSWSPSTDKLKEFVLVERSQSDDGDEPKAIEHEISEEKYVKFEKENSDVPFTLLVSFKNPRCRITKLSVASEARIIELYGRHGEYIRTHVCDLLNVDDEYGPFHHAEPDLSNFQELTVKFICKKSSLWVYGIKILYTIEPPTDKSQFNVRIIEDILRESNRPLTDKASKALKFLEIFGKSTQSPPATIDSRSTVEPAFRVAVNRREAIVEDESSRNGASEESVRELKNYVDACVSEVERRVTESVNERLSSMEAKTEEKLNLILGLLQNKT